VLARGALTIESALRTCRQVALALEAAHRNGVIHCDLKPQNIMVSAEGEVKLLDFGLAAAPDPELRSRESRADESTAPGGGGGTTSVEGIAGTPSYMSPEQWSGEPKDPRVDLWAFGCVLYECLTGQRAFTARSWRDRRTKGIPGPDLDALPAGTPGSMRELVVRCLAESPADRPESIVAVRRAIEEALARGPAGSEDDARLAAGAGHNLPRRLAPFIGRTTEKREVGGLLERERLVTLTGAGGTGKTRLALEVASAALAQFPGGAWLIELAALSDPELLPHTVAAVLGVREESGARTVLQTLTARLAGKPPLLIVLDNAEHLLSASAALVHDLLQVPGIRFLVTSREPIGIPGEWTYHVRPLAVPKEETAAIADLEQVDAVRLFLDRLKAVDPRFELTAENAPAVCRICRRLDGIPLALELAAARARVLTVEDIAARLGDRFRLLSAGSRTALPRHQTLRALIDWSHDQLTEPEQVLFRRLAAFAGGWTLAAAEEVAAFGVLDSWAVVDLLFQLVSKSVVERDEVGEEATGLARYRMLETIRDYARERLIASGDGEEVAARHRQFFRALMDAAAPHLTGPKQGEWLVRLDVEQDNLRRAIEGFMAAPDGIAPALIMARGLGRYWMTRGHFSEGLAVSSALLVTSRGFRETALRRSVLSWKAIFHSMRGELRQAAEAAEEYLVGCEAEGDERGMGMALNQLGAIDESHADLESARKRYEASLAIRRRIDDRAGIAQSLNNLGVVEMRLGESAKAITYYEESLAIRKERGDRLGMAQSMHNMGTVYTWLRQFDRAVECYRVSLEIRREVGDPHGIAGTLSNLGAAAVWSDQREEAREFLREALPMWHELGLTYGMAETVEMVGILLEMDGRLNEAVKLFGFAAGLRERDNIPHSNFEQEYFEGVIDRLRPRLEAETFEAAWGAGRTMTTDEVVELGLTAMGS
jgi:non-specific serine/threonine protein kinase